MISLLAISFLAQRSDWIEGAIIVGFVVISMLASAGKWIVQQLAEKRERSAQQREGMPINPPPNTANIPPFAAPVPPEIPRTRKTTMQPQSPVMERMMEVLLEKASGTKLERRIREMMPQPPTQPPPHPPSRVSEQRIRKQTAQSKKPARSLTIAEREAHRERARKTEVELETERLNQREQQFTDDTDQRLGHVVTHIAGAEVRDAADAYEIDLTLDDPEALRRAFLYSEILAPPLALRE